MKYTLKVGTLFLLFFILIVILYHHSAIPQRASYHQFADTRTCLGIPYCADTISSSLFIALGLWGIAVVSSSTPPFFHHSKERVLWQIFFAASIGVGLGSIMYHWHPSNVSLTLDRLPLSILFMTFFCLMLIERVHYRVGLWLTPWLLLLAAASVLYWMMSEHLLQGDLRPYLLVQFFPIIAIPLLFLLFRASYPGERWLWMSLICYGAAKGFEIMDRDIFEYLKGQLSGHTLKHLFAALSLFLIILYLKARKTKTIR